MRNEINGIKVGEYVRTESLICKIVGITTSKYLINNNKLCFEVDTFVNSNQELYLEDIIKHSPNLIDIIEDGDFCKIEFYSPSYEKRRTRIFEVSKIDEYITFENMHCDFFMINGEWSNGDKELNPVIKSIVTKEQFESVSYKVKE